MNIAVYCSAKDIISERFLQLGDVLGQWIGQHGWTLVYGGATGGLMSRVSSAAKRSGATVVGVVPKRIIQSGRLAEGCDELYTVETMAERKAKMREMADCFVCLPGSYGTLDEMMDVLSAGIVGEHRKPLYVVNYEGYYNFLVEGSREMKEKNFLPQTESYSPIFVGSLEELFTLIHQ